MTEQYLTAKEVATLLNVTDRTLLRWRKRKLLVPKTIGGKLFYSLETLKQALKDKS